MDYVYASLMKRKADLLWLFLIYDIMCVWKIHLAECLKELPADVRLILTLVLITFAIPKMHIHGHRIWCQLLYSLNLLFSSGQVVLYPESRSDDRMPAGRSETGYRKKVPDNNKMTGQPREDTSTTRVSYRVSVAIWPIERRG
jgi:hypothetical protein